MNYPDYIALRQRAEREGWHHWCRIAQSRDRIPAVEVHHAIAFTDPYDLDAPMKVVHPSPRCVAELMAGGIHPSIEAIHGQMLRLECEHCGPIECRRLDAPAIRATHTIKGETVIDNSAVHLTVAMPMTYEQAIEWIIQKDIPFEVWGKKHNRPMMAIVPRTAIPEDRTHRNDWKLKDLAA